MGMRWGLQIVDAETRRAIEGIDPFEPEPFLEEEVDLILVGRSKGPISRMLYEDEDEDPGVDDEELEFPDNPVSPKTVARCAKELAKLKPGSMTPQAKVLKKLLHSVNPGDETAVYLDLVRVAEDCRRYVEQAAAGGHGLIHYLEA